MDEGHCSFGFLLEAFKQLIQKVQKQEKETILGSYVKIKVKSLINNNLINDKK